MGGACRQMGEKRHTSGYWWKSQRKRDHLEDKDVGWWIILKWISCRDRMEWCPLDWSGSG
jgi:hypothetical protein